MIKDLAAYGRLRVDDRRVALESLDLDASAALAEALLTSSIMDERGPRDARRPVALARALRVASPGGDRAGR